MTVIPAGQPLLGYAVRDTVTGAVAPATFCDTEDEAHRLRARALVSEPTRSLEVVSAQLHIAVEPRP